MREKNHPGFAFFEVVRVDGPNAPEEIRGMLGYVGGKGEVDGAPAVFIYELERVWCLRNEDCISQGYIDQECADHSAWAAERVKRSWLETE